MRFYRIVPMRCGTPSRRALDFIYDESGKTFALKYSTNGGSSFTTYYYVLNLQCDVVKLVTSSGTAVATYTYDAWGNILTATGAMASVNPLRYRGYYYDTETGFYYLQSRYYDPVNHRFINADVYASTDSTDAISCNMFAYCGNNPAMRQDSTGHWGITTIIITVVVTICAVALSGCSEQSTTSSPREDLANAPDLDISTASPNSYNCYGNAIGKQIVTSPTGYTRGDSTRKTFEAVKNDLGSNNVRELTSISDPIGADEFKVALKCGPMDYHFIRLDGDKWYNKSGTAPGLYIDQRIVAGDIWCAMWMNNGQVCFSRVTYYDDETIYFAVKVGWDAQ